MNETAAPSDAVLWAADQLGFAAQPDEVRGLRFGSSPWLLRFGNREVILRISDEPAVIEIERRALEAVAGTDVPAPGVLGSRVAGTTAWLLTERIEGESTIPVDVPVDRLRALGALAARIARLPVPTELPRRVAPIGGVDFASMRVDLPEDSLMRVAERAIAGYTPTGSDVFVHGDLWEGNVMWAGDRLTGVLDWDCAGIGKAGIDLGSLRGDAAQNFGLGAETYVLEGWETEADAPADDVAYWDVVTELATPPDMGWFVDVAHSQGRPDLTRELMLERRDDFLRHALERL